MDDPAASLRAAMRRAIVSPTPADLRELYSVSLSGHEATGFTTHRRGSEVLRKPASLAIVQVASDPGFYLLYLDDRGEEITDTYHDDLEGAFGQAAAEFGTNREEWKKID